MTTDVHELVNRWAATEQANDPDRIGALLAPNFVGVGPAGFVLTRDQWLERFASGLENRASAAEDAQVHDHGTTAVVVGVDAQETFFAGGENSGRFRLTLTAVQGDDGWRVASVHLGPLQGGPPGARPTD